MPRKKKTEEESKEKPVDEAAPEEEKKEEIKEEVIAEAAPTEIPEKAKAFFEWVPKTQLGKDVLAGKISLERIFFDGIKITEPEIADILIPNLENEVVLIGGSTGKGGGIRRTTIKRTARMHKSGRRYRTSAMIVVGNRNGYVGLGVAKGPPGKGRELMSKALQKAKLNIIPVVRSCGSWECMCGEPHSIPFAVSGRSGSVTMELKPAPKGIGLCVSDEVKKLMMLAGIKDVWCKTRGKTQSRLNLLEAAFDALKKINKYKIPAEKQAGMKLGKIE